VSCSLQVLNVNMYVNSFDLCKLTTSFHSDMKIAAVNMIKKKQSTLKSRNLHEAKLESQLSQIDENGVEVSGCGMCSLFRRETCRKDSVNVPKVHGLKSTCTTKESKLEQAYTSMKMRTERLKCKMYEHEKEALLFSRQGNKTEALAALKRSKFAKKQFLNASSAVDTLCAHIDGLEEANLQKEIADALSNSARQIKTSTKGLLDKTEAAIDDSSDVRDLTDDMNLIFQGFRNESDKLDDEDLMEELEVMMNTHEIDKGVKMSISNQRVSVSATPNGLPSVPNDHVKQGRMEEIEKPMLSLS